MHSLFRRLPPGSFRWLRMLRAIGTWAPVATGWVMAPGAQGEVRLSEFMAAPNGRALARDAQGRERPGSGAHWADPGFSMTGWRVGAAPLGFGGAGALGTNVSSLMRQRTPGLYVRRTFTVTTEDLENQGQLELRIAFNDGFVAYLNGREAGRANAGPAGQFIHRDQPAYNFATAVTDNRYQPASQPGVGGTQPATLALGRASDWLRAGENVLAVHLLNREPDTAARIDANLVIAPRPSTIDLWRADFAEANSSEVVHRSTGGVTSNTATGVPPVGSWLDVAPPPRSSPDWEDLELLLALDPSAGFGAGGGLRVEYQHTGPIRPASWSGPAVALGPPVIGVPLTPASLSALTLSFRFRASAEVGYALRLEPSSGDSAASLTGLPPLAPTSGTAAAEAAPRAFQDASGGSRRLEVSAAGTLTAANSGTIRNVFTLSVGGGMRDFAFRVVEDPAAGAGAVESTGHLRCEVTRAAAVGDSFGFTLQPFLVRSWTVGQLTPAQLRNALLEFDARLPAGVPLRVWLEPSAATAGPAHRLDLGSIAGTGEWQRLALDPSTGTNQAAFLAAMNALATATVRIAFRSESALPLGTAWQLDDVGFVPWRTYSTTLAAGANADAFLAALNAQTEPRFFPVWDQTGTAVAPRRAQLVIDDFAVGLAVATAGTERQFISFNAPAWQYWPGLAEPSGGLVEPADFASTSAEPDFEDWIEIENTGPEAVRLDGWSLSTRPDQPRQWTFPAGTTLGAGDRLVVLASGRTAPVGAAWMHATITLPADGGFLALIDPAGTIRDGFDPGYAPQNPWHSYGRNAEGVWGFLREASPGTANTGPWASAQAAPVQFSPSGGFITGPVTVTLLTETQDARIFYTLDGSEPGETNAIPYTGPVTLHPLNDKTGHVLRARAFRDGQIPSPVTTQTYLIDQHPNLRKAPAIALTGDPGGTFYRPAGIFAIQGGTYLSDLWVAQKSSDYNMPTGSGRLLDPKAPQRPYERPAHLEFLPVDGTPALRAPIGLRVASSPYSRPRLRLTQAAAASPWPQNETEKPSLNVFFRDDYGSPDITYPLIPETAVRRFEEFRLRAGKNDLTNPFIRDEFVRRLFTDMGQTGIVGSFNGLWINGVYKGYFNLCERIREPFLRNHHPGSGSWDVNYIGQFENGDDTHFRTVLTPRLNANLSLPANHAALAGVLDLANAADYYLLMTFGAMWDWPHNNWAMARERASHGRWRCYVWDAEGAFGLYGNKSAAWNTFSQDLLPGSDWLSTQFRRLMSSAEWRLLFADRIQKHFFNGGALTDPRLTARKNATAAEVQPFLAHAGLTPDNSWFTSWMSAGSGRKRVLFPRNLPGQAGYAAGHFRDPNGDGSLADTLWPLTLPPTLDVAPGNVPAGTTLTLALAPGVPPDATIHFTVNGGDPREWGGALAAAARVYDSPVPLSGSTTVVRARVRSSNGEWSPMTEAVYRVGTVPASASNLVVSEIMYHPPPPTPGESAAGFDDPDDFEFLALSAIGPAPVDLGGLRFREGVSFDFASATRTVADPGSPVLLARNRAALIARYGEGIGERVVGEYFGGLSNGGEFLKLETKADAATVKAFRYGDTVPWPAAADGRGASLLLRDPESNPDHDQPSNWIASAAFGGQPGGILIPLTYADWTARVLPDAIASDPARFAPDADADSDGWSNLLEFLLLADPADPRQTPALEARRLSSPDGDGLEVSALLRPGAAGGVVTAETSTSLAEASWRRDAPPPSTAPQPDGSLRFLWKWPLAGDATAFYVRLRFVPDSP